MPTLADLRALEAAVAQQRPTLADLRALEASALPSDRLQIREGTGPRVAVGKTAGDRAVEGMGTMERLARGAVAGTEDLGLGATQIGNQALQLVGAPGAATRTEALRRDAMAMEARKRALYDTTAGTIGQVLPALFTPGGGHVRAATALGRVLGPMASGAAGGAAYGALQPVTDEGQRAENALASGAGFGLGSGAAQIVTGGLGRVISPFQGQRAVTEAQQELLDRARSAEAQGFRVQPGQRTGSKPLQTAASVIEELPIVGRGIAKDRIANQTRSNQILSRQFGRESEVITDDVLIAARERLGKEFRRLVKDPTPIKYDRQFLNIGRSMKNELDLMITPDPGLRRIVDALYEQPKLLRSQGGAPKITGKQYQVYRTELADAGRSASRAGNDNLARQISRFSTALDGMAGRSLGRENRQAFRKARNEWQGMRIAEDSIDDIGNVALPKYRAAIKRHRPGSRIPRGGPDPYKELRRSMEVVENKTRNSGTAQRIAINSLLTGAGGAAAYIDPSSLGYLGVPLLASRFLRGPILSRYPANTLAASPGGRAALGVTGELGVGPLGALLTPALLEAAGGGE